jgi:sulfite reductase (NADPH) flavoprotein alpha-component
MRKVRVLEAAPLTGAGSAKDVRHVVIDLADSGLVYTPGDALALRAPNDPDLVTSCLAALCVGDDAALREAFTHDVDIARPLARTMELLATAATPDEAAALRALAAGEDGAGPEHADLLDLLMAFPSARPPVADLVRSLPRLKPRSYSIASSLRATPGQVHLCVGVVRVERHGRLRHGVASGFLAHRAASHGPVDAMITPSKFRLPPDPATPIIMVGPGTGIAPFRAFLQEREATGQRGRAWLFFGDQQAASDFLYREALHAWCANGTLTRLDTAFSRDQDSKIYVQDRMMAAAGELWRWLQDGAHVYVCGDATRMARDVDAALRAIVREYGEMDEREAKDWVVALARQGRYLKDVY